MDKDTEARLQRLRDESAVKLEQSSPAVMQGLMSAGSGELHAEGWQPVQRSSSPPVEAAEWEVLSPSQMSQAGSLPRALSFNDLLDTDSKDLAETAPSPRSPSSEVLAAAEAAAASPMQSMHRHHSSFLGQERRSPLVQGSDTGYSSDGASDGVLGIGAALSQGFRLASNDPEPEQPLAFSSQEHTGQEDQQHQDAAGMQEQPGDSQEAAFSDHDGSYAHISQPASLQSFDLAPPSRSCSPASFQAQDGVDDFAQDLGDHHWLEAQAFHPSEVNDQIATAGTLTTDESDDHPHVPLAIASHESKFSKQQAPEEPASPQASSSSSAVVVDHPGSLMEEAPPPDTGPLSENGDQQLPAVDSYDPALPQPVLPGLQPSHYEAMLDSNSHALFSKLPDSDDDEILPGKAAAAIDDLPFGLYSGLMGAAAATRGIACGTLKWLQEMVVRLSSKLPQNARALLARAVASTMRPDPTILLGLGLAVVGTLYANSIMRNHKLARALQTKERDMAQLVMKVFNLQDTLQSGRRIPIVRHTSTTCSFSFAGGGVAAV